MDKYRLNYHLMPKQGSLADPNGMSYVNGIYHIYYLYNPLACLSLRRTACVWAHYSTSDFIEYKREPIALYPDTPFDRDGVYSGSALYEEGILNVFYTGNVRYNGDFDYIHNGREQNVMYVQSNNMNDFQYKTKLFGNEAFPKNMTQHIRDPYVWKKDNIYLMLLGARSNEDVGGVLLYQSDNKKDWHFVRFITTPSPFGYMWECPEYRELNGHQFLITCPQGVKQNGYHYQNAHQCGYFEISGDIMEKVELSKFNQFDYGFDLYASRVLQGENNQMILIGWMGMPECEYNQNQTKDWQQAMIMPRILTYKNHHLYQQPLKELEKLRKKEVFVSLDEDFIMQENCFELIIDDIQGEVDILLREDCHLRYSNKTHLLTLSLDTCGDFRKERYVEINDLRKLHIFSDTSSLEIFINDGYYTMTSRIFGDSNQILIKKIKAEIIMYPLSSFKILA